MENNINTTANNLKVIQAINEKRKEAPTDWAEQISVKMNKSVESIWAYARGERGIRSGFHIEVLNHLNIILEEKEIEIQKATA